MDGGSTPWCKCAYEQYLPTICANPDCQPSAITPDVSRAMSARVVTSISSDKLIRPTERQPPGSPRGPPRPGDCGRPAACSPLMAQPSKVGEGYGPFRPPPPPSRSGASTATTTGLGHDQDSTTVRRSERPYSPQDESDCLRAVTQALLERPPVFYQTRRVAQPFSPDLDEMLSSATTRVPAHPASSGTGRR